MREILFRGKRLDFDSWFYGSYVFLHVQDADWKGHRYGKAEDVHYIVDKSNMIYAVDPKTVGQYSGFRDKYGTRIFDGDIIKHYTRDDDNSAYSLGVIFFDDEETGFKQRGFNGRAYYLSKRCVYEVIGNIHDNPELLNGKLR